MLARAVVRTARTLTSSHFFGLLIKSMLLALIGFTLFIGTVFFGLRSIDLFGDSAFNMVADVGLTIFFGAVAYFLLPVLLPLIAAFFQETIADRIETRDYPEYMPPACERPFWSELWDDVKFVVLVLALNVMLLWTYFTPLAPFTYYGLNGYLIGREFFDTAATRHIGRERAKALRREHSLPVFFLGASIVFLANVPVLQLIAPFVGVAMMVHLYHLLPKKEELLLPADKAQDAAETA